MEGTLSITENGQYKNVRLKTKYKQNADKSFAVVDGQKVVEIQGLEDGEFVYVKKETYAEGREIVKPTYTVYSCEVQYKDEKVSFMLYPREHAKFAECGGLGDTVKITLNKELKTNPKTGMEFMDSVLSFEKVE